MNPANPDTTELDALVGQLLDGDVQLETDGETLHYDAPADTEDAIGAVADRLRRHKTELIRWLSEPPGSAGVQSRHPLSYAQRRLWTRHRQHPDPSVYNVRWELDLAGELDPAALGAALAAVVARHEALRTRFVCRGGHVVAEVMAPAAAPVPVADTPGAELEAAFDLGTAPLLRAGLTRRGERRWTLLLVLHHLACDHATMALVLDELSAHYAARLAGVAPRLAAPGRYADYARWERRTLDDTAERARLLRYWRTELAGAALRPPLPYDRPPSARRSGLGAEHRFTVGGPVLDGVDAVARQCRGTRYTVLCAAFALLLSRLTGQQDVVVTTSTSSRLRPEHESVVGVFTEALPLRVRMSGAPAVADLVTRVGATLFAALDHRPMPLGMIVDHLEPHPAPGLPPVPTVLFTVLGAEPPVPRLPGVVATVVPPPPAGLARMEFYLTVLPYQGGLLGVAEYATDLFDRATVESWCAEFVAVLEHAAHR